MGDKKTFMLGTGQGDREPSMKETGEEGQGTSHSQRERGPIEGAKQGDRGHSMEGAKQNGQSTLHGGTGHMDRE